MSTRSRSPVQTGRPLSPTGSDGRRGMRSPPRHEHSSTVTQPTGTPSNVLGVFGLSTNTREHDIKALFSPFGPIKEVKLVYDTRSQMSRGFGFIYFESQSDAERATSKV